MNSKGHQRDEVKTKARINWETLRNQKDVNDQVKIKAKQK
jgi:hypothetical protein